MRVHHWKRILCDSDLDEEAQKNLIVKDLLKMKIEDQSKYEEISVLANKEMVLEETLESMRKQWKDVTISHFRDPITGNYEMEFRTDIIAFIEEQIIKTQMNIYSPYSSAMLPTLKDWLQKLQRLKSIIDTYQKSAAKRTYLDPLFVAEDIAYQMPEEWRTFQDLSAKWKTLTERLVC